MALGVCPGYFETRTAWKSLSTFLHMIHSLCCRSFYQRRVRAISRGMPAAEEAAESLQGASLVQHHEGAPRPWGLLLQSCQGMLSTTADEKPM